LIAPFASATDQTTVSGRRVGRDRQVECCVVLINAHAVVVAVSALISPLAVPPAVCAGEPHEMPSCRGWRVAGGVVAGGVVAGRRGHGRRCNRGVVTGGSAS